MKFNFMNQPPITIDKIQSHRNETCSFKSASRQSMVSVSVKPEGKDSDNGNTHSHLLAGTSLEKKLGHSSFHNSKFMVLINDEPKHEFINLNKINVGKPDRIFRFL